MLINKGVLFPCHFFPWVGQGGLLPCVSHGGTAEDHCPRQGVGGFRYCIIMVKALYLHRLLVRMESSPIESIFDPNRQPLSPKPLQVVGKLGQRRGQFNKTSRRAVHRGPTSLAPKPWAVETGLKSGTVSPVNSGKSGFVQKLNEIMGRVLSLAPAPGKCFTDYCVVSLSPHTLISPKQKGTERTCRPSGN